MEEKLHSHVKVDTPGHFNNLPHPEGTQARGMPARAPPPPSVLLPADLWESQAGAQAPGVCSQGPCVAVTVFVA